MGRGAAGKEQSEKGWKTRGMCTRSWWSASVWCVMRDVKTSMPTTPPVTDHPNAYVVFVILRTCLVACIGSFVTIALHRVGC